MQLDFRNFRVLLLMMENTVFPGVDHSGNVVRIVFYILKYSERFVKFFYIFEEGTNFGACSNFKN